MYPRFEFANNMFILRKLIMKSFDWDTNSKDWKSFLGMTFGINLNHKTKAESTHWCTSPQVLPASMPGGWRPPLDVPPFWLYVIEWHFPRYRSLLMTQKQSYALLDPTHPLYTSIIISFTAVHIRSTSTVKCFMLSMINNGSK